MITLLAAAMIASRALLNGIDASFIPEYRDLKAEFVDGGKPTPVLESFARRGVKLLRLRIWVNPPKGYCSLERTLVLAKEAKKYGMRLLLDFHYADDWADPQKQPAPAAWKDMDLPTLEKTVETYTYDVLRAMDKQKTAPEMVQIGNEVRNGMLWPLGSVPKNGFAPFGRLLKAGIKGTRRALGKRTQIMVHYDEGAQQSRATKFFENVVKEGVKFDVLGLSYYPWWHGTLEGLQYTMNALAATHRKPVMIVETAYPFTLQWNDNTGNFLGEEKQLAPGYPATPEGQAAFLRKLNAITRAVPGNRGLGVCYWAPEYVAWPGMQTPCENLCLYDFDLKILPGADALGGR